MQGFLLGLVLRALQTLIYLILETKRCLLLGRKAIANLDSKLKSRDITLLTKVHLVKAMCFSRSHIWM